MEAASLGLEPLKPPSEPSAAERLMQLMRKAGKELKEVYVDNIPVQSSLLNHSLKNHVEEDESCCSSSDEAVEIDAARINDDSDQSSQEDDEDDGEDDEHDDENDDIKPMDLDDF